MTGVQTCALPICPVGNIFEAGPAVRASIDRAMLIAQQVLTKMHTHMAKKTFSDIANKFGNKYNRCELNQLVLENKIKKDYYLTKSLAINVDKYIKLINFNLDEKDFKNAKKQMEIYLFLKKREKVLEKEVLTECKATKSSLKALEKKEIIEYISEDVFREAVKSVNYVYEKPILNVLQKDIVRFVPGAAC